MTTQARQLITKKEGICGGSATISGTRIRVADIVGYWRIYGEDATQVHGVYPHLSRDQIEAALGYYQDNRNEIDELMRLEEKLISEARWPGRSST